MHTTGDRWVRYTKVPEGHFYAVHDRLSEPPLIAIDLEQLAVLVRRRQSEMEDAKRWAAGSDLRAICRSSGDDVEASVRVLHAEATRKAESGFGYSGCSTSTRRRERSVRRRNSR